MFNRRCCCQPNPCEMACPCEQRDPIMEPVMTSCIEREFYHDVPHCCPIHTHVINKHIYTHTYTPQYSCDEENVIINNDCGGCCKFMGR